MSKSRYFTLIGTAVALTGLFSGCALESKFAGDPQDEKITADVETLMEQHPDLEANTIYVSTRDHVVYLSGVVDSPLEINEAKALVAKVPGVEQVVTSIGIEQ